MIGHALLRVPAERALPLVFAAFAACSAPDAAPVRSSAGTSTPMSSAGSVNAIARPATPADWPTRLALGHTASASRIALLDTDVDTTGAGLPAGRGTAIEGAAVYAARCASCHGAKGEGIPPGPPLVQPLVATDSFPWGRSAGTPKTIGNYWPFATTMYAYLRHAMPLNQPGSLTPTETYQLVAWLLAENGIVARDAVMDARSLSAVRLPMRARFVEDNRRGGPELK